MTWPLTSVFFAQWERLEECMNHGVEGETGGRNGGEAIRTSVKKVFAGGWRARGRNRISLTAGQPLRINKQRVSLLDLPPSSRRR